MLNKANGELLKQALEELPLEFREVVILRELEGPILQADCSDWQVMSRLTRAYALDSNNDWPVACIRMLNVTCQQTQELLHGYIDGELDLLRNVEIEQHMNECQTCSLARQEQLALRAAIRESSLNFAAPERLQRRVKTALRAESKKVIAPRFISRHWRVVAAPFAIIMALSGIAIWILVSNRSRSGADDLVAQDVVSSHVKSRMVNHITDVASSDQHTVKSWFDGKLDFAPQVKDLAGQGFPLVGGRVDYIGNRAVAALVYQRQKHYINLLIWPSPTAIDQPGQEFSRQGQNVIHWIKFGTSYWAVSDVNNADLREFVRLAKE